MGAESRRNCIPEAHLCAFTLIELLVVVAIIALLIAILLPSLGNARAQARTTLCASRVSQMVKSVVLYTDDYGEMPPFILKDCQQDLPTEPNNRRKETWLGAPSTMARIYSIPEDQWYAQGDPPVPQNGDLFLYARFAEIYRCPEFQRESRSDQHVFNITRSIFARSWKPMEALRNNRPDDFTKVFDLLKTSSVYAPAQLGMMFDEAWDAYVGWTFDDAGNPVQCWGGHDPMLDLFNSCVGQYHGAGIPGWACFPGDPHPPQGAITGYNIVSNYRCKTGSVGYYDSHVELSRDPLPNLTHIWGRPDVNFFEILVEGTYSNAMMNWWLDSYFGQCGKDPRLE
jgi:prepilin-type N-terminal cleavage/methylation domain-containing protein